MNFHVAALCAPAACLAAPATSPAADIGQPAATDGRIGAGLECVPVARSMSGIQIYGDAWTWWDKAADRYKEGTKPKVGAVLVFRPHGVMKLGHVAVVSRIVSSRILMITHGNWSRTGGVRGQVERDVTLVDVSKKSDWSAVRVWWRDNQGLGGTTYPVYGFIYGTPAAPGIKMARPSPELTGRSPDIVGAVIDSLS